MALKKIHTLVAVAGIAVLGAGAWYWQNKGAAAQKPADGALAARAGASGAGAGPAAGGRGGPGAPGSAGGPGGGPAPVEAGPVQALTLTDDAQAVGSLRSRQGIVLRPEVSGRVAQINFGDGQRVKRGQLLVQLDDTLQLAQLKQADAQAAIARTNLQRSRELLAQSFVSQSAVDQNEAALQVAEAQVALAKAQLARMRIVAPFDATAGIRQINLGDYLKDGADIVALEDMSSMAVDFRLPERYLARVKVSQPVELAVDALPDRRFKGRVEAVDAQVDANGRSLLVRARVDNPDAVLRPGMFARPRIVFAVREQALVVPEEALVPLGSKQYVYKIEPDGKGGQQARRLEARLGLRLAGKAELLQGVAAGDRVVTAGHARLARAEVTPVRVIDIDNPRPPGAPGRAASGAGGGSGAAPAGAGASAPGPGTGRTPPQA
ncbi:MAG: efflux RND transporter periplasmic adaptor subunit [Rubrivivax sp.]